jgi:hypothetical protein
MQESFFLNNLTYKKKKRDINVLLKSLKGVIKTLAMHQVHRLYAFGTFVLFCLISKTGTSSKFLPNILPLNMKYVFTHKQVAVRYLEQEEQLEPIRVSSSGKMSATAMRFTSAALVVLLGVFVSTVTSQSSQGKQVSIFRLAHFQKLSPGCNPC